MDFIGHIDDGKFSRRDLVSKTDIDRDSCSLTFMTRDCRKEEWIVKRIPF